MRLELRHGNLVWVKADGRVSEKPVSHRTLMEFFGFPQPSGPGGGKCLSLKVLAGDPSKDNIVLVQASGNSRWGGFLVSKLTRECVEVRREETDYAKGLVDEPPQVSCSLGEIIERNRQAGRDAVDIETLAQQRGLRVWEARDFNGYWCRQHGEFDELPEGWGILPTRDAALTRRVRKGHHWLLMRRRAGHSEAYATVAPAENIERASNELGGAGGAARREESKGRGQKKREEKVTARLEAAIRRCFPRIPEQDLNEILAQCRRPGAVGAAQWLYFATTEESDGAFDNAARQATRAHVRHRYTKYDAMLSRLPPSDEARSTARSFVAGKIAAVLEKWEQVGDSS